jgi:hypothetical protein
VPRSLRARQIVAVCGEFHVHAQLFFVRLRISPSWRFLTVLLYGKQQSHSG